jgi:hypothetical protein
VTDDFGNQGKSVTIDRNSRSHLSEMTGHALPKWAVTMDRNTHSGSTPFATMRKNIAAEAASYNEAATR